MGERVFTKSQYGVEVTKGTAVAATAIWPGTVSVPPDRAVKFLKPATGRRGGAILSSIPQVQVDGLVMAMPEALYAEKIPLMLSMLLDSTVIAGTGASAGSWTYVPVLTAAPTVNAITLEWGDDSGAYEAEYVMAKSLKIRGKTGEEGYTTAELTCFGKQISKSTFTGALTTGTLTPIISNLTSMWIDATYATLGTTAKQGLLREFDIEITNNFHPKIMASGALTMSTYGIGELSLVANLTFEGNAAAITEYDAFAAQTLRAIRLLLGDTTNGLQIDMIGKYETIQPLGGEQDGNNLYTAVLVGMDDNQATPHKMALKAYTAATTL